MAKDIAFTVPQNSESRPEKQVTTWIKGGLGNQLFQYATGRAVAMQANAQLLLDTSEFSGYIRGFDLPQFGIDLPQFDSKKLATRMQQSWNRWLARIPRPWIPRVHQDVFFKESSFAFQPIPLEGWQELYLKGYWQSYRYFDSISAQLKEELSPLRFLTEELEECHLELLKPNSVSVHIRRGDYVSNPHAAETHGILTKPWYDRAVQMVQDLHPDCSFHVFSDDTKVAHSIAEGWPRTRVHPVRQTLQDFLLISSCQHKIIANSTFSWWGAWLSQREGRVIAPRNWFARQKQMTTYVDDLFPIGWILV